ncbi:hypothetical protein UFOVP68_36 [uncultured Caudovirales phage]|uniref:Uncharacterized protein n=1 Tax=uncultured Caudovirales phage TaxID=2100421 RepID=A0A6J5KUV0_9CAUD|nr:hypothetical protein UFOVP68_36 [uncultured Caudovirales phage]
MLILSADPGVTGAIASYDTITGRLTTHDMPILKKGNSAGIKAVLDEVEVLSLFSLYRDLGAQHFFLEQVNGFPGQSAPRAFNFGVGYGVLRLASLACGYQLNPVPAVVWKNAMRAPKDKLASIQRATELVPSHSHLWKNGTGSQAQRSGRAEAAMLVLYGERVLGNRQ